MKNNSMFEKIRKSKTVKLVMAFAAINFLVEMAFPTVVMALTAGSSSPEFASFEPVATTDMVNDFTGDFTYNLPVLSVPGPDGGGYSMSLSYHSGGSSEEEASWVGFGWALNPGAINRQKRGYVDEFDGTQQVTKYNKLYPNWTHTTGFNMNMEYNSSDDGDDDKDEKNGDGSTKPESTTGGGAEGDAEGEKKGMVRAVSFLGIPLGGGESGNGSDTDNDGDDDESIIQPSVSFSKSIRFNNYSGFSITTGFGAGVKGMGSLNMNRTGGENTLNFQINPIGILQGIRSKSAKRLQNKSDEEYYLNDNKQLSDNLQSKANKRKKSRNGLNVFSSNYSAWSFGAPAIPYSVAYNVGRSYNFSMSLGVEVYTVGFQFGLQGNLNYQANEPKVDVDAYGYLHSPNKGVYTAIEGKKYEDAIGNIPEADFQIEKGSTFNKHDKNLGIPFNNADVFMATGNGVVGGFKFYQDQIGHYYPTFVNNEQNIVQAGVEVAVGQTIAIGLDAGLGFQHTKVQDWNAIEGDDNMHSYNGVAAMAFNGDMGGQVEYTGNDELLYATVGGGYMNRKLDLSNINNAIAKINAAKAKKSSNVKYDIPNGKIEVTNKDGNKSVYGEYIESKEEYELSVGLDEKLQDWQSSKRGYTFSKPVDLNNPLTEKTVVGIYSGTPYKSTFLLTQNLTFDYVDVTGNGPTEDDFGGWTKFSYDPVHTNYQYRAPYNGVIYSRERLIDGNDQSGSVSTGQKDVKYLKSIETKTHIAFFVTNQSHQEFTYDGETVVLDGSTDVRTDGLDADPELGGVPSNPHHLRKLERIVLYAKNDLSKPISTTYFQYDYSLCKGIPNTVNAANGKLTLKKVWTESGGTVKSKIAPYQFDYNYHLYTENAILNKYPTINEGYLFTTLAMNHADFGREQSVAQNPMYQDGLLDPWGSYRLDAENRFNNMQPWVDQEDAPEKTFDPAAWQLKQIKLPSGGEIHVQYEQKDYRYVQDQKAMVMASLKWGDQAKNGYKSGSKDGIPENRYYLNLEKIGLDPTDTYMVDQYVKALRNHFVGRKNKLYFKMLYSYKGGVTPNLDIFRHDVDYLTGYCAVNKVEVDDYNEGIYFELGETNEDRDSKKDKTLPRYVGYQKFLTAAHRNIGWGAKNVDDLDDEMLKEAYNGNPKVERDQLSKKARSLAKDNTFDFFGDWTGKKIKNQSIKEVCELYNFDLSYFKIPVYNAKKGGGIRVKRLLSYDPGIVGETGDAMIYGSEYIYQTKNGLSSGVATNEPQSIREESALVGILERNKQSGWDRTFNGRDSKQYEGPLGESLLPGAQVVYERVIVKNIHSGLTTTGYAVNNYHTTKNYPMIVEFSDLSKDGDNPTYKKYNLSLPLGLLNLSYNKAWVTQGYLFKLNDMNGKVESQATYAGNYSQGTFREAAYTSKTTYDYSNPGDEVKTMLYNNNDDVFVEGSLKLGQEEDLTMYRSRVRDVTNDFSLELDINFLIQWPPAFSLGFGLSYAYTQNELSQHVTSKVIRQKTVLKSTTTTTDGVTQITKNIAFDRNTGDPVLTQTFDGYMDANESINTQVDVGPHNGHYYALNIPASWMYPEMGRQADNDDYSNQLTASVGNVVTYGSEISVATLNSGLSDVVNASATVYKKNWFANSGHAKAADLNAHYYPQRTYVYRSQVKDANDNHKIYGGGTILDANFDFFTWDNATDASNEFYNNQSEIGNLGDEKWYSASEIMVYSENGYPVQEQDVLGINSAAKFGYNSTLPVLVAQNAAFDQVHFIDFESVNLQGFDNDNKTAHSGNGSFNLTTYPQQVFIEDYPITPSSSKGVSIKLWLKSSLSNDPSSVNYNLKNPSPKLQALIGNQAFNFKRVAQTGDWSLYVVNIKNFNGLAAGDYNIQLGYNFMMKEEVFVDDFRIQPLDAVMNCTVYNKDNKVAAQFDDQHFGVFYEYNNKEQLVRKSIETERGKKTLQEQQYNTPLMSR